MMHAHRFRFVTLIRRSEVLRSAHKFLWYGQASGGAAAIEFAIFGSLLSMLLVVGVDYGLAFYSDLQVQTSAQSGAEYASLKGFDTAAITSAVTNATSTGGISASPAPTQFCGCPSTSAITNVACGTVCADGTNAGTYVSVTATRSYSTLLSYPSVPATYNQTATSTVRIK